MKDFAGCSGSDAPACYGVSEVPVSENRDISGLPGVKSARGYKAQGRGRSQPMRKPCRSD